MTLRLLNSLLQTYKIHMQQITEVSDLSYDESSSFISSNDIVNYSEK